MKKPIAILLSLLLAGQALGWTVSADAPHVETMDGQRTAFVSSFGRINYEGESHTAFRGFTDAFEALGHDGGRIVFAGKMTLSGFKDTEGRSNLDFLGVGTKASGNLLDFSGAETVSFKGSVCFDMLNIKADKNAVFLTNGYDFVTLEDFDTYSDRAYPYPAPLSVAPGNGAGKDGVVLLNAGVYNRLTAGAYSDAAAAGIGITLSGGKAAYVSAGNTGGGSTAGDTSFTLTGGTVTRMMAGSDGGRISGNVTAEISGGTVSTLEVGVKNGAVIDGNLTVIVSGGSAETVQFVSNGTVKGKTILIEEGTCAGLFADAKADYVLSVSSGTCRPVYEGTVLSGFMLRDKNSFPAESAVIDGQTVEGNKGVFSLSAGTHTVSVPESAMTLNGSAAFTAGYEDGTFRPQNNMSRAEAVTVLSRLLADEESIRSFVPRYEDVSAETWYAPYIGFFQSLGLLSKVERDMGRKFAPDEKITRGEFTQLLYRLYMRDAEEAPAVKMKVFSDVDGKNPYAAAISVAVNAGLVTGYDDETFRPDGSITRAEVVTMVNRLLKRTPTGETQEQTFSDIDAHWAKEQILAACGSEGKEWTAQSGGDYILQGTTAKDYVTGLYEQSASLSGEAICRAVDVISRQMKQDVLNSTNELDLSAYKTIYYVSEKHGSDENDGLTPETALKTLEGVNNIRFLRNATVLFERGGVYRGHLVLSSGVNLGAYGEGSKPLLMQSRRNYADPALWEETEYPNVWRCTELLINVGVIGFDHDLFDYSDKTYDELYGSIRNYNTQGFMGVQDLDGDLQFYCDFQEKGMYEAAPLYVYSDKGNPGERFHSIEIGERVDIIDGSPKNCTIDNLAFKFTGAHAIGVGNVVNFKVTNCVFSWLGGSVILLHEDGSSGHYGNAVESFGGCDGFFVENNWMYQIYDTAVTHQHSRGTSLGDCIQKNVRYLSNLMEYCHWGIEFYNMPTEQERYVKGKDPFTRITENVYDAYNVVRNTGFGWGTVVKNRPTYAAAYCSISLSANRDELTEYNIFDRSVSSLLWLPDNAHEIQSRNIYIQYEGNKLGILRGYSCQCDGAFAENIREKWKDKEAVVVMVRKDS